MGLDTYAVRPTTEQERIDYVEKCNAEGGRPVLGGLATQEIKEPLTLDDAPQWSNAIENTGQWEGINLVGGMMSSNGQGSFRGKVYAGWLLHATGFDLYRNAGDYDHQLETAHCAAALEAIVALAEKAGKVPDPPRDGDPYGFEAPDLQELYSLARFFRVCADNGYAVDGWW